jgi:hypothetical protein
MSEGEVIISFSSDFFSSSSTLVQHDRDLTSVRLVEKELLERNLKGSFSLLETEDKKCTSVWDTHICCFMHIIGIHRYLLQSQIWPNN